jgi:catechol 2,3-dioxygenase-like lactoylglutathione lyase family enzyme
MIGAAAALPTTTIGHGSTVLPNENATTLSTGEQLVEQPPDGRRIDARRGRGVEPRERRSATPGAAGFVERPPLKRARRTVNMRPHIDVITLAVGDLDAALAFYRDGLGLESPGIIGTEFEGDDTQPAGAVAMFQRDGGLILALSPRQELAKDAHVSLGPPSAGEFSVGHAVASRADVDALLARAEQAGATVTQAAHDRPWGIYSGYFRDLDGHLWESCGTSSSTSPLADQRGVCPPVH